VTKPTSFIGTTDEKRTNFIVYTLIVMITSSICRHEIFSADLSAFEELSCHGSDTDELLRGIFSETKYMACFFFVYKLSFHTFYLNYN